MQTKSGWKMEMIHPVRVGWQNMSMKWHARPVQTPDSVSTSVCVAAAELSCCELPEAS